MLDAYINLRLKINIVLSVAPCKTIDCEYYQIFSHQGSDQMPACPSVVPLIGQCVLMYCHLLNNAPYSQYIYISVF